MIGNEYFPYFDPQNNSVAMYDYDIEKLGASGLGRTARALAIYFGERTGRYSATIYDRSGKLKLGYPMFDGGAK